MEHVKKNLSICIGEIMESQNGTLHGRINGQKVFLNQITAKDGSLKWLVNAQVEAYITDPKPKDQA